MGGRELGGLYTIHAIETENGQDREEEEGDVCG